MVEKKMKTTNIKGKEYVEVNERVKWFRDVYPGYFLETELLSNENGVCVFKAIVRSPNGEIVSTGHAYEKEDSTFINKTSYIENCETSAVGRALGFLGIGIDASIASSDEVSNAINNQGTNSTGKIDFKLVREKIKEIKTIPELLKYWSDLKLSDKQKEILNKDFAIRKAEIGENV